MANDTTWQTGVHEDDGGDTLVVEASRGAIKFDTTPVKAVKTGTTSLDPASILATTRGSVAFTLTGAAVGDLIHMQPPSTLEDDLIFCGAEVTAADTVTVYLYNPTAGAIDGAALTWRYIWIDLT